MADILDTEAGLMLVAEQMSVLANRQILKLVLILSQRGPMTLLEINRCGLGKVSRVSSYLRFLEDQGTVIRVRRKLMDGPPGRKKNKTFYHYFVVDEFIPTALMETISFLKRSHQDWAQSYQRLEHDLLIDERVAFPD